MKICRDARDPSRLGSSCDLVFNRVTLMRTARSSSWVMAVSILLSNNPKTLQAEGSICHAVYMTPSASTSCTTLGQMSRTLVHEWEFSMKLRLETSHLFLSKPFFRQSAFLCPSLHTAVELGLASVLLAELALFLSLALSLDLFLSCLCCFRPSGHPKGLQFG